MAVKLFYSYSSKDERFREKLDSHLKVLRRNGLIEVWGFRKIEPGADWKKAIDTNLESAQIILLLISPDFLASDYCMDIEVKRALEKHRLGQARVIPIIIRDCHWQVAEFADLQALPPNARPVRKWRDPDTPWKYVVQGIEAVAKTLLTTPLPVAVAPTAPPIAAVSEIDFPERQHLEFDRYAVSFPIRINGKRTTGLISGEALQDHFGADLEDELVAVFAANRSAIEATARELIAAGRLSPGGELLLTSADFQGGVSRNLTGAWATSYHYDESGVEVLHADVVHLTQTGDVVTGYNEGDTDHRYTLEASFVKGSLVSGNWRSTINPMYHGTFQLLLSADARTLSGKWLGISQLGKVRQGDWVWQRQ